MTNPNALVKAKEEGRQNYQTVITANETLARNLEEIAGKLTKGHALAEEMEAKAAWEEGRLIAEAYRLLGGKEMTFQAWWQDEATWAAGTRPAPFSIEYARKLKRLYEFCTHGIDGIKRPGQAKVPDGFTTRALVELTAPKYIKDRHDNELVKDDDGQPVRTEEAQRRVAVVDSVYERLKKRASDRRRAAEEKGTTPAPITHREVQETLREEFTTREMPVQHKRTRRTNLQKVLDDIERQMAGWYHTFEGRPAEHDAMRAKLGECLAEWIEWQKRDRPQWEAAT